MGWLQDQFKDLSLQGQAKNPLQLLVNPMAVGTVGLATLKDQDNKTGWFSNLFKPKKSTAAPSVGVTVEPESSNKSLYIIFGIVIVILIIAVIAKKKAAP